MPEIDSKDFFDRYERDFTADFEQPYEPAHGDERDIPEPEEVGDPDEVVLNRQFWVGFAIILGFLGLGACFALLTLYGLLVLLKEIFA